MAAIAEPLLELARQLFAVITDGAPRLAFNIRRGCAIRRIVDGKLVHDRASYTPDTWLRARDVLEDGTERDRLANPFVLGAHLAGKYDVAIEAASWCSYVVLDIDRPAVRGRDAGDELAANRARDEVLGAVWRAYQFGPERRPVVLSTPGGGYHLYLPFRRNAGGERTWPQRWARRWHELHLDRHGLPRRPGRLELYPSNVPLRAPCGRGTALLTSLRPDDPDDLRLVPVTADRGRMVREFLAQLEAAHRPIEA